MDGQASGPSAHVINAARTLAGATVGGALGFFAFGWLVSQGFYAPAIPGVLLGVGGGFLSTRKSVPLAVTCGFLGLALGIVAEWRYFPFTLDESFGYFLSHLADLKPPTQLMIALGGLGGFWFVWRSRTTPRADLKERPTP